MSHIKIKQLLFRGLRGTASYSMVFLLALHANAQTHKGISFQGVIKLPGGEYPSESGLTVDAYILSSNNCILRQEQFSNVSVVNGYINLVIGTGVVGGYDPGLTLKKVMDNSAIIASGPTQSSGLICLNADGSINGSVTSFDPSSGSGARKFRLSLAVSALPVVADFNMRSVAYAINAETLNGRTENSFINTSTNITQNGVEAWFASAVVGELLTNTYNAPSATTISGTIASNKVTGLATVATSGSYNDLSNKPSIPSIPSQTGNGGKYLTTDGSILSWSTVSGGGSGTITEVVAGTGLSGGGNTGSVTVNLSSVGTAGTYTKVTTDAQGRVTSGTTLSASDIPGLDAAKITSGTFADALLAGLSVEKILSGAGKYFGYKPNNVACGDNEVLKYDSSLNAGAGGWKCGTDNNAGTPSDASYSVKGLVQFDTSAATSGIVVNSGVASVNMGTTANKIVQLNASAELPAVSGANLTNLNAAQLASGSVPYARLPVGTAANTVAAGDDSRFTDSRAPNGSAGGDLSGTYPNPTVAKVQNTAVSTTTPLTDQVYKFNGTSLVPVYFGIDDLRTAAGASQFSTSCSASQTLTWSAVTDAFTCNDIAGLNASVITAGTIDAARLPASASYWSAATGGINYAGGNVGIGTTDPQANLHVKSDLIVSQGRGWKMRTTSYQELNSSGVRDFALVFEPWNQTGFYKDVSYRGLDKFLIEDGVVGIGTSSPLTKLHIESASAPVLTLGNSSLVNAGDSIGAISFSNHAANWNYKAAIRAVRGAEENNIGLQFDVQKGGDSGAALPIAAMAIDSNGNVGIGTTSPKERLDFGGITLHHGGSLALQFNQYWDTVDSRPEFLGYGGTAYSAGIGFDQTTGDMVFSSSSSAGAIDTAVPTVNNEKMRITAAGNVGIGTTNPTDILTIASGSSISNVSNKNYSSSASSGSGFVNHFARGTQESPTYAVSGDRMGWFSTTDGVSPNSWAGMQTYATENHSSSAQGMDLRFYTNSNGGIGMSERMRIDQSGYVGIGTTAPTSRLHVLTAPTSISASGEAMAAVEAKPALAANAQAWMMNLSASTSVANSETHNYNSIYNVYSGTTYQGAGTYATLLGVMSSVKQSSTASSATGSAVTAVGGNATLASNSDTVVLWGGSFNASVSESKTGVPTNAMGGLKTEAHHYNATTIPSVHGAYSSVNNDGTGTLTSASAISASTLNNAGGNIGTAYGVSTVVTNNGAGNITTAYGLQAAINDYGAGTISTGYGLYMGPISATTKYSIYTSDATAPSYFAGKVGIGTSTPSYQLELSTDSAAKPGTSTWTIASDERLKDIRAPFNRGLASILGLSTIYFKYKQDNPLSLPSDKEFVGIRAQDVKKVIPEAVTQDDKGYLHVTNDAIIWTAVNSIKELYYKVLNQDERLAAKVEQAEFNLLKAENEKLKIENAEIKSRLERIERALGSK